MSQNDPRTTDLDRLLNESGFTAPDSDNTDLSEVPNPESVVISYRNGITREAPPEFLFGRGVVKMAMVDPDAEVIPT